MTTNLCTYFDKNYLSKFLTCMDSVFENEKDVKFFCLCLDDYTFNYLETLKNDHLILISLKEIENCFLELKYAKKNREKVEYYFTLSPFLPLYIIEKFSVDIINYIDSDLFFFDTPKSIVNLLGDNSIIIIEHGIKTKRFGKFNVGWLTFKNDDISKNCLKRWGKECVNWCYDYVEGEKYADQKYLDKWPSDYKKVKVLSPNFNVAPWNFDNKKANIKEKKIFISEYKIIFFHFHGLHLFKYFFSSGFSIYNKRVGKLPINYLYKPYISRLENYNNKVDVIETRIRNIINYKNFKESVFKIFKLFIKIFKMIIFLDFYKK